MDQDLKPQDMPPPNHPLMQSGAEIRTLSDLIDARENQAQGTPELDGEDQEDLDNLDVSEALTFPHKKRRREPTLDDITDFDGDARTSSPADDEDDASYMTRADVVDSMNETDPDPNTGMGGDDEFIGDSGGTGRATDITGTVTGAIRGLGTHLPQDLGGDGFQIIEPEELDPRAAANVGAAINPANDETEAGDALNPNLMADDEEDDITAFSLSDDTAADPMNADERLLGDDLATDGGQIPIAKPDVDSRDEALDATRQLK